MFHEDDHLLILGATGLFGIHLFKKLDIFHQQYGFLPQITLVTRNKKNITSLPPFLLSCCTVIQHDFLDPVPLSISSEFTHIIHMATTSAADTFNGATQFSKYLLLLNSSLFLRDLLSRGCTTSLLFVSSGVAYGPNHTYREDVLPTLSHLSDNCSLAFGKLNAEYILGMACREFNTSFSIARCFSFISPYLPCDLHYAIGNFVSQAVSDNDITILSDGLDTRSYQHLDDTMDWLIYLLHANSDIVLNVGSDYKITILDLAVLIRSLLNSNSNIQVLGKNQSLHNARRRMYVPDISLATSLGLTNKISLEQSILQLADVCRSS